MISSNAISNIVTSVLTFMVTNIRGTDGRDTVDL